MTPDQRRAYEYALSRLIAANCPPILFLRDAKTFARRHLDTLHRARERGDLYAFQSATGWWSTTCEALAAYLAGVPFYPDSAAA